MLCGKHQNESTKGILSKETIKAANSDPICRKKGYSHHLFDLGGIPPTLILGSNNFSDCGNAIAIAGRTLLGVLPPEKDSKRWRLSGHFKNSAGHNNCQVIENELRVDASSFDFVQVGRSYQIYDSSKNELLHFEIEPPHTFKIISCTIKLGHGLVRVANDKIRIDTQNSSNITLERVNLKKMLNGISLRASRD